MAFSNLQKEKYSKYTKFIETFGIDVFLNIDIFLRIFSYNYKHVCFVKFVSAWLELENSNISRMQMSRKRKKKKKKKENERSQVASSRFDETALW